MNILKFNRDEFAERLKELRKKECFSQEMIADKIGISEKTYGKYEQKTTLPSIDTIVTLSEIYDKSIDYILLGKEFDNYNSFSYLLEKCTSEEQEHILQIVKTILSLLKK